MKMGYNLTAIILLQAKGDRLTEAETAIAKAQSVIAVYDVTGDFDAVIIAKFKDQNSLNTFLKQLSTTPFVKRTATNVALTRVKADFRLKL
jgi:Lrp/AsnC family transcriptional regulator for asnA, asnC and gidA